MKKIYTERDMENAFEAGEINRDSNNFQKMSSSEWVLDYTNNLKILQDTPEKDLLKIASAIKTRLFEIMKYYRDKGMESPQWTYLVENNCIDKVIKEKENCSSIEEFKIILAERLNISKGVILKFEETVVQHISPDCLFTQIK